MEGRLPSFIVIGAMKAGTTTLHGLLAQHPDIYMSREKELNFFTQAHNRRHGLAWYRQQFPTDLPLCGESSPLYASWPQHDGVPEAILAELPDVRLIYCVRDPISRAVSHFKHLMAVGEDLPPVDEGIFRDDIIIRSRYATQLDRYLEAGFPLERIHVVQAEQLKTDRAAVLEGIYSHLGVDASRAPEAFENDWHVSERKRVPTPRGRVIKQKIKPVVAGLPWSIRSYVDTAILLPFSRKMPSVKLSGETMDRLKALFSEETARLRSLTGHPFAGWSV
ncbi:MAG: sulfotransferase [Pseudomonadota bacterium]